jgi:N-acetylglucosaminylphosphatidylinositol deacetylase
METVSSNNALGSRRSDTNESAGTGSGAAAAAAAVVVELHVLVIAHPDDESMFFVPWLRQMQRLKEQNDCCTPLQQHRDVNVLAPSEPQLQQKSLVWLICMTTGDYDGLGATRSAELHNVASTVFRHVIDQVILIDQPRILPDHPRQPWDTRSTSSILGNYLRPLLDRLLVATKDQPTAPTLHLNLVTFDKYGVSGHINHRDTFYAVRNLHEEWPVDLVETDDHDSTRWQSIQKVSLWTLESVQNPLVKYIPVREWIRFLVHWTSCLVARVLYVLGVVSSREALSTGTTSTFSSVSLDQDVTEYYCHEPWINWQAMATHESQFVWYRRLFVVFSCYTYCNRLRRVHSSSAHKDD